jgi:uncharacterized protein (DUF2236 family)
MASFLRGFPWRLPPGRSGDPGLYGPGSVTWRVNGEGVLMLGGPRALLMQIAHPAVAAGVARFSDFPADAFARLWRTLDAMLAVSFGDTEQAERAIEGVTAVHRRIRGRVPGGEPYRAMDPELLLWVHATLVDSALVVHERFFETLEESDRDAYVREMGRQAELFGVRAEILPGSARAFQAYVGETLDALEVSDEARALAPPIVRPPVPLALRPVARFQEVVTVGLLSARLREAYGLRWTAGRARALRASQASIRALAPRLPEIARRWPHARAAARRAAERPARSSR